MPPPRDKDVLLKEFREELVREDAIHDGDSIGTDDETLSYVTVLRHSILRSSSGSIAVQAIPPRAPLQPQTDHAYVEELPTLAQHRGRRRNRPALSRDRPL